eukprot:307706_1
MFATTASQMLRDDQRLRNLHRETKQRRKRFLAKQKKLQDDEERRRITALQKRRKERNRHLSCLRNNRYPNKPIKVSRPKISTINKNNDEFSTFIVPVCDQLPTLILTPIKKIRKNKSKKKMKKSSNKMNTITHNKVIIEKQIDVELNENKNEKEEFEHFENAMSDELSVVELDNFEKKHFGIQQSVEYNKTNNNKQQINEDNNQNLYSVNCIMNHSINSKKINGYQQIFKKNTQYKKYKNVTNESNTSMIKSIRGSLFNINDIDMKTPEDNDSVKINPKDSIDCNKTPFSTIYNSNLLPLQSVLGNKRQLKPYKTTISCNSHQLPYEYKKRNKYLNKNKTYGIKLPRLTESILKEKDRLETLQRSPKSTFSAPMWNKNTPNDIGYNIAMNRRRKTTTIIDDFFTKTSDEFVNSHRNSNNTMFLPNIDRVKLKSKSKLRQKPAYSVISEYDILREEKKLQKSLSKINETLTNLAINERNCDSSKLIKKRRNVIKYPNYMRKRKVPNIPRKIKVRKSPVFKSKRRRKRWNI